MTARSKSAGGALHYLPCGGGVSRNHMLVREVRDGTEQVSFRRSETYSPGGSTQKVKCRDNAKRVVAAPGCKLGTGSPPPSPHLRRPTQVPSLDRFTPRVRGAPERPKRAEMLRRCDSCRHYPRRAPA